MTQALEKKLAKLKAILREMEHTLIAYSGGVDSSFLLKVAFDVLGEKAAAITAISPSYPAHELDEAEHAFVLGEQRHHLLTKVGREHEGQAVAQAL